MTTTTALANRRAFIQDNELCELAIVPTGGPARDNLRDWLEVGSRVREHEATEARKRFQATYKTAPPAPQDQRFFGAE